jgi:hypothetical protein
MKCLGKADRAEGRYESLLVEHGKLQQDNEALKQDKLKLEEAASEVILRKTAPTG